MIKINNYDLPSTWEEFSPEEFLTVSNYITLYTEGKYTVDDTKILLFCALTNFRIERLKPDQRQKFISNLLNLLNNFNFFYEISYPESKFKNISVPIREQLRKIEPEKLSDPEARAAIKLKRTYIPDLAIKCQLLPTLRISRRQLLHGYSFDCRKVPETSLTAEQFIDANQAYEAFIDTRDMAYLDLFVAILYCKPYTSDSARKLADTVKCIPASVKNAALLNYMGILNYLFYKTDYAILFKQSDKIKGKNKLGMTSILFSISEKGYGSLHEISNLNLFTFFDLIRQGVANSIQECLALEMQKSDIAEKLDLPLEVINEFI